MSTLPQSLVSLVIPVFNEEASLPFLFERLESLLKEIKFPTEIVFVDDGSKDASAEMITKAAQKDSRFKLIKFSRNFGHQTAITAGMEMASGDAVIVMDADLQDPPEVILQMIEKWTEGYQVVYGVRESREGETFFKKFTAGLFYRILRKLSSLDIPLDTGDFRLLDRKVIEVFKKMPERARFVRGMISWIGFKQIGVKFHRHHRVAGTTKYPFHKMLKLALDGMIGFSTVPLRLALNLGLIVALLSFLYGCYVVVLKLCGGYTVSGWSSLMVVLTFLGGVQLFFLGVLGEYLGRVYDESLRRPLYIVSDTVGFNR